METRKRVLNDLLEYAGINESSIAIIHYNIARIAKAQGNDDKCQAHLSKAREKLLKLLATRLGLDPLFDDEGNSGGGQQQNPPDEGYYSQHKME